MSTFRTDEFSLQYSHICVNHRLGEEVGIRPCKVGRIAKGRMKWAGHMVRMKNERLPKCSETKKQEGFRKRGRPPLRWKDFEKRDQRKADEEEKWRETVNKMEEWGEITKLAVPWSEN